MPRFFRPEGRGRRSGRQFPGEIFPVTKLDIIRAVCERLDMTKPEAAKLVQATFDALTDSLVQEGRVELRNFGVFQIKRREARLGRNPRTGEAVPVAPKCTVTFKPGKEMELRVRQRDATSAQTPQIPAATAAATERSPN